MRVKAVCAYVDLGFQPLAEQGSCLPAEKFRSYAAQMGEAIGHKNLRFFDHYPFAECWAVREFFPRIMRPNCPTAPDRFTNTVEHARCQYVQHQRLTWARMAAVEDPEVDVWVWLDTGVLKQGAWRGEKVEPHHITDFFDKVRRHPPVNSIPFPGILPRYPIADNDQHWRFCGSVHIWPTRFLPALEDLYKQELRKFVMRTNTIPGDLPIWGHVEARDELPFRFYQGEYGYTQFTNYPEDVT
jgi:hypothetical protein